MNAPKLPTPYELCRIAAALRGKDAKKEPDESIKKAMSLWSAARQELSRLGSILSAEASEIEATRALALSKYKNPFSLDVEVELDDRTTHDNTALSAMCWLEKNADKRDTFKTISGFKAAWLEFRPGKTNFKGRVFPIAALEAFVERRLTLRHARDAERKRQKRTPKAGQ